MNEIVFENRNKSYGAYALRKGYNDNVIKGFMVSSLLFAFAIVIPMLITKIKPIEIPDIDTAIIPMEIIREMRIEVSKAVEPVVKPSVTPPPSRPSTTLASVIKVDDNPDPDPKKVESTVIGTGKDPIANSVTTSTATASPITALGKEKEKEPATIAAFNPEFKGDLMGYLAKNIRYPAMAVESGIFGTVYLSFIVDEEGEITNVKVLRGIGFGCDKEAMDVVKKMPAWKPGRDENNQPIKVIYTLPVKFKLDRG